MGEPRVRTKLDPERLRLFTQAVLRDLDALRRMIDAGQIESGVRRIGAEQEFFLSDTAHRPACRSMEILAALDDRQFTTELGLFNLEVNLEPLLFSGTCLSRLEGMVSEALATVRTAAARIGVEPVLTGILPTLRPEDLRPENMAPVPRYHALNDALAWARGGPFELRLRGADEINIRHDSVMLESCNTSWQVHFQVAPDEFARFYNIAQVATAPLLAVACNSPLLFGKRLWRETRIALFEQSIDTRTPSRYMQERSARVIFGRHWVRESILEIYEEDVARFRVFMMANIEEDPLRELDAGRVPRLRALSLHNGTVYRWNRPCYGVRNGVAHLRIENRVLPSGPTVVDEVANATFWFGLISGLASTVPDVTQAISFTAALGNFVAAARLGLDAQIEWLGSRSVPAADLILSELLPLAERGLSESGIDAADIERYLGIIEQRVARRRTGANWLRQSLDGMGSAGTSFERSRALVAAMKRNERSGRPVHEWTVAELSEAGCWMQSYERVGQFMSSDLFTVHEDEVIDLLASVMAWRNIRHVPVENTEHKLVGMVSYRSLLLFLSQEMPRGSVRPVAVMEIMERDPVTVTPETPAIDALELMRDRGVACLPVVDDGRLIGIVTEHDFMNVAAHLLKDALGRMTKTEAGGG